jgi:hypothetical protein
LYGSDVHLSLQPSPPNSLWKFQYPGPIAAPIVQIQARFTGSIVNFLAQ